ncbi:hypothetical protein [Ferruginibacter sp.]
MQQSKTILSLTIDILAHGGFNHLKDTENHRVAPFDIKAAGTPQCDTAKPVTHLLE